MSHAASRSSLHDGGSVPLPPDATSANPLVSQNSDSSQSLWPPPRLRRAGQRYDGKSLSLASLATSDRPLLGMPSGSRSDDQRCALHTGLYLLEGVPSMFETPLRGALTVPLALYVALHPPPPRPLREAVS